MSIQGSSAEPTKIEHEKACNTLGDRKDEIPGLTEYLMERNKMTSQETIDQEKVIARLNDLNKESFDLAKPAVPPDKLIIDMTIEELREALVHTMGINKKIHDDHIAYTKKIEEVWTNKKKIKARYLALKDKVRRA
jgi:hypothetical protein